MMNLFFCLPCSLTSFLVERFCCIHCGNGESQSEVPLNLYLRIPEPENLRPGCHVPATDAGNSKSEEYSMAEETTQEVNNQGKFEENSDGPLQISRSRGYKNSLKIDGPSKNRTLNDFYQYTNANQTVPTLPNTNEGEFLNQSHDQCNAANLLEVMEAKPSNSKQTYVGEQSSLCEGENKTISNKLLRSQRPKEPAEYGINSGSFALTDSTESKYRPENLSDSSKKVDDRHYKDYIPPPFSYCSRGNTSMNRLFLENSVTPINVAEETPETSKKLSRRWCESCGRYFTKERTFSAHLQIHCNLKKSYKCGACGEIFPEITKLKFHKRTHIGEKLFKCTQCDYAYARPGYLKNHLKTHTKKWLKHAKNAFLQRFS